MKDILGKIYNEVRFIADSLRVKLLKKKGGKASSRKHLVRLGKRPIGKWALLFLLVLISVFTFGKLAMFLYLILIGIIIALKITERSKSLFIKRLKRRFKERQTAKELRAQAQEEDLKPITGWIIFMFLFFLATGFLINSAYWAAIIIFGVVLSFIRFSWYEVKYPDVVALFRFGKFVGVLRPGLHLILWGVQSIELVNREDIVVELEHQTMQAKESRGSNDVIEIEAKVYATIQPGNSFRDIKMFLELPKDPVKRLRLFGMMTSNAARLVVGKYTVSELTSGEYNGEETTLAKQGHDRLEKDLSEKHGCHVETFGVEDFNDPVKSEEGRLKSIAKGQGATAEELAKALKGFPEAASVMETSIQWRGVEKTAAAIMNGLVSVVSPMSKKQERKIKDGSDDGELELKNIFSSLPGNVQEALKGVLGGKK